jgi:hypothetical protein
MTSERTRVSRVDRNDREEERFLASLEMTERG